MAKFTLNSLRASIAGRGGALRVARAHAVTEKGSA